MNIIEKFVYDRVKKNPKIKIFLRNVYQGFFDLLPRRKEFSINPIKIKEGYFFGFHDVSPFSLDDSKLLANKLFIDGKMPSPNEKIDVGFFNLLNNEFGDFIKIGETTSWNYHKGCRLQWLNSNSLIFNYVNNEKLESKIVNILTNDEKHISFPIDSVNHTGDFATSFSYERLEKYMPGYGYNHSDSISFLHEKSSSNTGLYLVDLKNNSQELLVSLEELSKLSSDMEASKESSHYVTHSLFSTNGNYISFFHRWVGKETRKRYTRLLIYDLEKKVIIPISTGYMVSHYVWNNKNEIIVYCNYGGVDAHTLIKVEDLENSHLVAYPELNSDGHQSFLNNNEFVTDTYGDNRRMSHLYIVNIVENSVKKIASVYSPEKFQTKVPHQHIACDLHPRVSHDSNLVCFDTAKSGKRSIAIMKLNKEN